MTETTGGAGMAGAPGVVGVLGVVGVVIDEVTVILAPPSLDKTLVPFPSLAVMAPLIKPKSAVPAAMAVKLTVKTWREDPEKPLVEPAVKDKEPSLFEKVGSCSQKLKIELSLSKLDTSKMFAGNLRVTCAALILAPSVSIFMLALNLSPTFKVSAVTGRLKEAASLGRRGKKSSASKKILDRRNNFLLAIGIFIG
jgi:hypothetical protein